MRTTETPIMDLRVRDVFLDGTNWVRLRALQKQPSDGTLLTVIASGWGNTQTNGLTEWTESGHRVVDRMLHVQRPGSDRCQCGGMVTYLTKDRDGNKGDGCEIANQVWERR